MEQNKIGRYFKYAIGEIILVVIGILIALQINNWNQQRIDLSNEEKILFEIKENLNEDLYQINDILSKNKHKIQHIDSSYYYLSLMNTNPLYGKEFSQFMPIVTNYVLFQPTRVAFNNLTSTGKIEILRSDNLRKEISRYYSDNMLSGIQNQITITTQNFLNNVAPKMINKTMMKFVTKRDFDVISITDVEVHKDPKVLSGLFVLTNKTIEHNRLLIQKKAKVNALINSLDLYLKSK